MDENIAECVGLWLAEWDKKTKNEITFTNNCFELICFFHDNIKSLYNGKNVPRIYIYSPSRRKLITHFENLVIKNYFDKRANKSYYIYRIADVEFVKKWKEIVEETKNNKKFYVNILHGIFAGEGNVKHMPENNNHRSVRISYKVRDQFIEKIFNSLKIKYSFDDSHRSYIISGRYLDKLNEIDIANLHPEKESKFRKMIDSIKEKHYSPGELKLLILNKLNRFYKTKQLSKIFERSELRILEVLRELKVEGKIDCIKINSIWFWIKKELKNEYLEKERVKILKQFINHSNMTRAGESTGLSRKTILKKLLKYKKEGLIDRERNLWKMTEKGKIICGIDEAGKKV